MTSRIVSPPPQMVAVQALAAALKTVSVSTQLPPPPHPNKFVVLSRIGGGDLSFSHAKPRFLVEAYASTEFEAEELAEVVRATWRGLRSHGVIYGQDDKNLVRQDDPDKDLFRFQFTGYLLIEMRQVDL